MSHGNRYGNRPLVYDSSRLLRELPVWIITPGWHDSSIPAIICAAYRLDSSGLFDEVLVYLLAYMLYLYKLIVLYHIVI